MYPYARAQAALAELKAAVYALLDDGPLGGMTEEQVGLTLGLGGGAAGRAAAVAAGLLGAMEAEGVAERDPDTGCWHLRTHLEDEDVFTE